MRLYKLRERVHSLKVRLLWKSLKKDFNTIGKNVSVTELPIIKGASHIKIGNNITFGKDIRLEAWEEYFNQKFNPLILIHDNVVFTERVYISCVQKIEIGEGTLIGRDVFIADNSHGDSSLSNLSLPPIQRELYSKGPVFIGKNVWIGRNVCILSGVTIGDGVVIGANSVVTHSFPNNCVIAGAPARIIKK